jgi:hypothetical protein
MLGKNFLDMQAPLPSYSARTKATSYQYYARGLLMKQQHKREGIVKVLHNGGLQEPAMFHAELMWKKMVENKIRQHPIPTGFIPDSPHNMEKIISEGRRLLIDPCWRAKPRYRPQGPPLP